jgi:transposase-like protein
MPKAHPKDQKITLSHLAKHFSDEAAAWQLMERLRWPDGPICPHCKATRVYFLQPRTPDRYTRTGHATQRRVWKCAECRKQFSVLVGTIFEDSKIPLSKWLLAVHLLCAAKNGVNSTELARLLEVTQKSAWFVAHRIRYAMERPPLVDKLRGIVEADETYIGGGPRKAPGRTRHEAALMRMDNETPVVSLVERSGKLRSQVMPCVTDDNVAKLLRGNVEQPAELMTDSSKLA